jgi:hypothetical protein
MRFNKKEGNKSMRGATAIAVIVSVVLLIALTGVAADSAHAFLRHLQLQKAVDAAVVSGMGQLALQGDVLKAEEAGEAILDRNLNPNFMYENSGKGTVVIAHKTNYQRDVVIEISEGSDLEIKASATYKLPTIFLKFLPAFQVWSISATARMKRKSSIVSIAVDLTDSEKSRLADEKNAAKHFLKWLVPGLDYVSLVQFGSTGKVVRSMALLEDRSALEEEIDAFTAETWANTAHGIELARKEIMKAPELPDHALRAILLFTTHAPNAMMSNFKDPRNVYYEGSQPQVEPPYSPPWQVLSTTIDGQHLYWWTALKRPAFDENVALESLNSFLPVAINDSGHLTVDASDNGPGCGEYQRDTPGGEANFGALFGCLENFDYFDSLGTLIKFEVPPPEASESQQARAGDLRAYDEHFNPSWITNNILSQAVRESDYARDEGVSVFAVGIGAAWHGGASEWKSGCKTTVKVIEGQVEEQESKCYRSGKELMRRVYSGDFTEIDRESFLMRIANDAKATVHPLLPERTGDDQIQGEAYLLTRPHDTEERFGQFLRHIKVRFID